MIGVMHVLTAEQYNPREVDEIIGAAHEMRQLLHDREEKRKLATRHLGEQVASIFYEASTRTKASFEISALQLGMGIYQTENAGEFSSIAKGETIEDTVKVLGGYGISAIVMRTKEEGLVARAAAASAVPVINAGDGKGEHPTQSLLDAYTIRQEKGRLEDLTIVMGGDLENGRTVRSLSKMMSKYEGNRFVFISTPDYRIGDDIKQFLNDTGTPFSETVEMYDALHEADVVYWTRLQSERVKGAKGIIPSEYSIDSKAQQAMNKDAIIMHPLPRIDEIKTYVDSDPRSRYFQQAWNGRYVRIALLDRAVEHVKSLQQQ